MKPTASPSRAALLPLCAALLAEWTKLRTLRSTWLMLGAAGLLSVGMGMLSAANATRTAPDGAVPDVVAASLGGLLITQLAFGVLGALAITGEYASGTLQTTLMAVPRRATTFAAKVTVLGALSLVAGQVIAFVTYFAGQQARSSATGYQSLYDPGVLRAVTGAGCYLFVLTMIGLGLGTLIRHTAGALAGVGLLFIEPLLARYLLPDDSPLGSYVLWWAGQALASPIPRAHYPSTGLSLAVCAGYTAAALIPAVVAIARRDA